MPGPDLPLRPPSAHACGWARRALAAVALLLLTLQPALGEPEAPPSQGEALARAYLARLQAEGAQSAWSALHRSESDPWILAEDLVSLDRWKEADQLSKGNLTSDGRALADYVSVQQTVDLALRRRVGRAALLLAGGDPAAALAALPDALTLEPSVTQVQVHQLRARALEELRQEPEAREARDRVAALAFALGWRRAEREALVDALDRTVEASEIARARRLLRRLLEIDDDVRDLVRSATWSARLGLLEARAKLAQSARGLLREADALFTTVAQDHGLAKEARDLHALTLSRLAQLHKDAGDAATGLWAAQRAHELAAGSSDAVRAQAARALGGAYQGISRLDDAQIYLTQAVEAAQQGDPALLATLKGDLAWVLVALGRDAAAETLYKEVEASPLIRPHSRAAYVLRLHRAAAWIQNPPSDDSGTAYRRAVLALTQVLQELSSEGPEFSARYEIEFNARTLMGRALRLLGRAEDARDQLQTAVDSDYVKADSQLLGFALRELGRSLLALGDLGAAHATLDRALGDLATRIRGLPSTHALSALGERGIDDLIQGYVACTLRRASPEEILVALEQTRAMVFMAEARRRAAGQSTQSAGEVRSYAALTHAVGEAARQYWEAHTTGELRAIRTTGERLYKERKALREREEAEDLAVVLGPRAPVPRGAQGVEFHQRTALAANEAMLYAVLADDTYRMVAVWQDRIRVAELGSKEAIETAVLASLDTWAHEPSTQPPAPLDVTAQRLLPAAVREHLGLGNPTAARPAHIYVSVDGLLGALPWAALLEALPEFASLAPEQIPTTSFVASQAALGHIKTWNPALGVDGPVLALGDPDYTVQSERALPMVFGGGALSRLRGSEPEVRGIVEPARGDVMLLGTRANERLLAYCLSASPYPFEILHLSCHGLLQPRTAWLSALALHATPDNDGLLTVEEVGRWQFRGGPRLVVLAACESGRGVPVSGEGEDGLVRAFQLAGARQVVASMWKVPDDASRDLMIAFHKALRVPGTSVAHALRAAQQQVREGPLKNGAHPYSWAAWAVWGPAR